MVLVREGVGGAVTDNSSMLASAASGKTRGRARGREGRAITRGQEEEEKPCDRA